MVRTARERGLATLVLAALVIITGCGGGDDHTEATSGSSTDPMTAPSGVEAAGTASAGPAPELRAELLEMLDADQSERTGEAVGGNDRARTERLKEIIDEYGWPSVALVGEDGATAAWAIAQHSDHDVMFQERALELMAAAVADGEADPSQLAFLVDRVAVNQGRPQTYGSQLGCVDGAATPAPIENEGKVDERRAEVGLDPLADYLAQFEEACADGQ